MSRVVVSYDSPIKYGRAVWTTAEKLYIVWRWGRGRGKGWVRGYRIVTTRVSMVLYVIW